MLLWLMLIVESIPKEIQYINNTNYIVVVSADSCGPCIALEKEWISNDKLKPMFTSVLLIQNPQKGSAKKVFKDTIIDSQPLTPTIIVYRYADNKMSILQKQQGYTKEVFEKFVERYKNEKSELEGITELPSLTEGIFGRKD